jgi:hypothetical protein
MHTQSRRNFITSIATAGAAVAAASLPAIASTGSDRKLLQLCRNWQRLERALNRLIVGPLSDAEQAYAKLPIIPKPAILLEGFEVFPSDEGHICKPELNSLYDMGGARSDRVPYLHRYDLEPIAKGKFYIEAGMLPGHDPRDTSLVPIPQAARDHAKACLAALDEWEATEQAQHAEIERWEAKANRLHELQTEIEEQIAELPASTMEGLNAKLAIVRAEPFLSNDNGIAESALADMRRIDIRTALNPSIAA